MLLYIIRHGDPIYDPDSLTPKGHLQAAALAKRLAVHGLDKIFASPLVRAQQTAKPTCELLGLDCQIEEWTSENAAWQDLSVTNEQGRRTWAFHVQNTVMMQDNPIREDWYDSPCFRGTNAREGYARIVRESDRFLEKLGYRREGRVYRRVNPSEERVAVFCHQGFGTTWLSHLLQVPPMLFWSGFDITHSSITRPRSRVRAARLLRRVPLQRISAWKFAPNAIRFSPANRSWWTLAAVWIGSTGVSV